METTRVTQGSQKGHFGPAPSTSPNTRVRNLSKARAKILELLSHGTCTVSSLATLTGQHENTMREHLDALVDEDLVIRYQSDEHSRGRPAWFYKTSDNSDRSHIGEYAGLASALAGSIARSSAHPVEDATEAGIAWALELVTQSKLNTKDSYSKVKNNAIAARRKLVTLLDQLGFASTKNVDLTKIKLTRCPLLGAARQHPDIICAVHLGIIRGALGEFGGDEKAIRKADLIPFALEGACLLKM